MAMAFDIENTRRSGRFPAARPSLTVISGAKTTSLAEEDAALQRIGMKLSFARNETIFSEGDEANYSYKVVSGAIRLCKHLADGRRQIAGFVLPGEYCGLLHLDAHRFTAEAASDLVVIAYPQRQVEALSETMPSMRRRLAGFISQRLQSTQDHVVMLGRNTAMERVASFLTNIAARAGAKQSQPAPLPMSRQDIADYLGLTIETVCRALSELKRAHVVALPNLHELVVVDTDALEGLAEGGE
jgi:CRP/FNR family nitrogen fixation transcriptional regulator